MKLALFTLLVSASAITAIPDPKFNITEDFSTLAQKLKAFSGAPNRRSQLTVPETDALVYATPQNDNNAGVLPLFGPVITQVIEQNPGASECIVAAALDYCTSAFAFLFKALCPITCATVTGEPPEGFCEQDDLLASSYAVFINLEIDNTNCATMAADMKGRLIVHSDNEEFMFCEHPALGLFCADTCNVNCWSWPPPLTTKAWLPGCQEYVATPKQYYKPMLKNAAEAGDSTICPPPYLD